MELEEAVKIGEEIADDNRVVRFIEPRQAEALERLIWATRTLLAMRDGWLKGAEAHGTR